MVYILHFPNKDTYYVGSTNDLDRRLSQHSSGHTPSTKRLGSDFKLVFYQEVASLALARKAEYRIKAWKRRDFIERIVNDGTIGFLNNAHP